MGWTKDNSKAYADSLRREELARAHRRQQEAQRERDRQRQIEQREARRRDAGRW
jgi:hypothetical protein